MSFSKVTGLPKPDLSCFETSSNELSDPDFSFFKTQEKTSSVVREKLEEMQISPKRMKRELQDYQPLQKTKNPLIHQFFHNIGKGTPFLFDIPYITSNEQGQKELLDALSQKPKATDPQTLHIGFSCWLNFEIIALRNPKFVILSDINERMICLYQTILEVIRSSDTPEEFLKKFQEALNSQKEQFLGITEETSVKQQIERICSKMKENSRLLKNHALFQTLKSIVEEDRICFLYLDITDQKRFQQMASWMKEQQFSLDTLYISNIYEWLGWDKKENKREQMKTNLKNIMGPNTYIIDALSENVMKGDPKLRLNQGQLPSFQPQRKKRDLRRNLPSVSMLQFR